MHQHMNTQKDWKIKLQGIFNRIKVSSAKFEDRIIEDDEMINKENNIINVFFIVFLITKKK